MKISKHSYYELFGYGVMALSLGFTHGVSAESFRPPSVSLIAPSCAAPGDEVSLAGYGFGADNVAISVAGKEAQVLDATGHSADFLVPLTVPRGMTKVVATNPGGQTGEIDFQVKGPEICGNHFDDDCDGLIDEADDCPVDSVLLDTSPSDQAFNLNESKNIATSLSFTPPAGTSYTVSIAQTINPSTGLTMSPTINGNSYTRSSKYSTVLAQELTSSAVGEYTITTTATIAQTGQSTTATAKVRIGTNIGSEVKVFPPLTLPNTLTVNATEPVLFTARVAGKGQQAISEVFVRDLDSSKTYTLSDNGLNGDLQAGDFVYSGQFELATNGMASGDCFNVEAVAVVNSLETESDPGKLCISKYPVGFKIITQEDIDLNGFDTVIGPRVSNNIINIKVRENADDALIDQIVTSIGGEVIGSRPLFGDYQIKLLTPPSSLIELVTLISELQANPDVIAADLTYIGELLSSLEPLPLLSLAPSTT